MAVPMSSRLAGPDDAPALAVLLCDFNAEFDVPSPPPEVLAPRLAELLAGRVTYAVQAGDPPVGLALVTLRPNVWAEGPVALLDELYVVPSRRDQGIGSALMDAALEEAVARGVESVEIEVDEGDVDARRFYLRHGFGDSGSSPGERAFKLHRELDP